MDGAEWSVWARKSRWFGREIAVSDVGPELQLEVRSRLGTRCPPAENRWRKGPLLDGESASFAYPAFDFGPSLEAELLAFSAP